MSQTLAVEVSDAVYTAMLRRANAEGTSPDRLAAALLERQFGIEPASTDAERLAAQQRFERHIGEVDLGHPTGADNASIDADLSRAYADTNEDG
jgi:hypothetical protein